MEVKIRNALRGVSMSCRLRLELADGMGAGMHRVLNILTIVLFLSAGILNPGTARSEDDLPLWDSAVNQILAAGLYGVDEPGTALQLTATQKSTDLYRSLLIDSKDAPAQSITLSYSGSYGLLGFSAGYIYTSGVEQGHFGSVLLDFHDPFHAQGLDPSKAWYMSLELSSSYQPHDDIQLGFASRGVLFKDPYDLASRRKLSLMFDLPVTYRKFITITPELKWFHPLSEKNSPSLRGEDKSKQPQDSFYGGVSVTFSY